MQRIFLKPSLPAYAVATVAFLASIGILIPAYAADAAAPQMVQLSAADTAAPVAGQPAARENIPHKGDKGDKVEARIDDLHLRLAITAAQEDSWSKVAAVMRDNASTMAPLEQARAAQAGSMTAVDDLNSYAKIAEAHADGIQKFAPAFETLYGSMSDAQKKNADDIFRKRGHKAMKHMAVKAG
ncbi:MAG: Spy/CpxP family protein refolding chaperone [Nevskiales bacterium]